MRVIRNDNLFVRNTGSSEPLNQVYSLIDANVAIVIAMNEEHG